MQLTFVRQHRSIKQFPSITLPNFVLLTGLNGAGKTHLLEAIENGSVAVEGIAQQEIRRLDRTNIVPQDETRLDQRSPRNERAAIWRSLSAYRDGPSTLLNNLRNNGITVAGLNSTAEVAARGGPGRLNKKSALLRRVSAGFRPRGAALG
jgi:ATPase subunit of ABC transporter with duplicated ATPase domains